VADLVRDVVLEIAVQDVTGAQAAVRAGARRLELCSALAATGGVTPGIGLLEAVLDVVRTAGVGVHVLVRSRPGGFVHASDEVDVLVREVRAAVRAGADGVVVGMLTRDGRVDTAALDACVAAASGAQVTFHRAFDVLAPDERALAEAVDTLVGHGVTRVLTSGGAARAGDGLERLARTVALADGRLEVMAGGGVLVGHVPAIVATGVDAVHLSASRRVVDDGGGAGPGGGADAGWTTTDPDVVAAARAALEATRR